MRASRAFVVLLRGEEEASRLASVLTEVGLEDSVIVVPPIRGVAFFADPSSDLDTWWGAHVPADAEPVYILGDEPGIISWTQGVDGACVIGVAEPSDVTCYGRNERVRAVYVSDVLDYVITVAHDFGGPAASMTAASLLGGVHARQSPRRPKPPKFRRARLDADTELRVAVPANLQPRPLAPRQLIAPVDDRAGVRGSEAFFTPTRDAAASA